MIKFSIAKLEDTDELSKLFFKIFKPKYKEYFNHILKEKTCRAISKLYIKAGKTIVARDKSRIIGFASAAIPLFSLWKQSLSNFFPERFIFMAPLRWKYLFKPFYLMLGVDSAYHKRGIGTSLSRELEKLVKKTGSTTLYTQIHSKNKPIKELLTSENWQPISSSGIFNRIDILKKDL